MLNQTKPDKAYDLEYDLNDNGCLSNESEQVKGLYFRATHKRLYTDV